MRRFIYLLRILRYLHWTIYINFKYLPLRQAIKLPIFLYKPRFGTLGGEISIACPDSLIKPGMIALGFPSQMMYPNDGFFFEIAGEGKLIFRGSTFWGNGSGISVGPKGKLIIGEDVFARVQVRCCAYHYINIGDHTLFAWNILLMDTSFHTMKDAISHQKIKEHPYGPIIIGNYNWIGSNVIILRGVKTVSHTTIAAGTVMTKNLNSPEYSIIGGSPVKILKNGYYCERRDSEVEYTWYKENLD